MKKISCKLLALSMLCLASSGYTFAQKTGSYDSTITFMGAPRVLSAYVPTTYDPTVAYKLIIGLHGLGDNSASYRSALVSALSWGSAMPNTIFVCPEALTTTTDYYTTPGSEEIIQAAIDLARAQYNIDTTDIVLQGFSLGGRAALRYGLDNPAKFKGLLLNTPAVQGVKQAINGTAYYAFNYANAGQVPIYITRGMDDILYEAPVDSAFEQLILNDGIVRYYQFPGLGHGIPPIGSIINYIDYFDTPSVAGYDMDVVKVSIAQRSCTGTLPAAALVRNTGTDTIHTAVLNITAAGTTTPFTWTGKLGPFQHAVVTLPTVSSPAGNQTLSVAVTTLDAGTTDTVTANNTKTAPFQVVTTGTSLPLIEGFEGVFPPANWIQYLAGDAYSPWAADSTVKRTGIASMGAFNTIFIFDNIGRKEEIASPLLNLTTAFLPVLSFDVAYNYHHYSPPFTTIDTSFADTLEIMISTDCGDTYTSIYKKGGAQLATFADPIANPASIAEDFIDPATGDWRTEHVDLAAYTSSDKAIVKFCYTSALGGSINIDNISFSSRPGNVKTVTADASQVYPNPVSGVLHIMAGNTIVDKITITDALGKVMMQVANNGSSSSMEVSTAQLNDGLYLLQVFTANGVDAKKLIVMH